MQHVGGLGAQLLKSSCLGAVFLERQAAAPPKPVRSCVASRAFADAADKLRPALRLSGLDLVCVSSWTPCSGVEPTLLPSSTSRMGCHLDTPWGVPPPVPPWPASSARSQPHAACADDRLRCPTGSSSALWGCDSGLLAGRWLLTGQTAPWASAARPARLFDAVF